MYRRRKFFKKITLNSKNFEKNWENVTGVINKIEEGFDIHIAKREAYFQKKIVLYIDKKVYRRSEEKPYILHNHITYDRFLEFKEKDDLLLYSIKTNTI